MLRTDEPVYQADLESEIIRLVTEIEEDILPQLTAVSEQASMAEAQYKVKHAKAYLSAQGPTATRTAQATVETENELFQRLVTDRGVTTVREKLRAYQASLDSLRTLLVGVREQVR